MHNTEFPPKQWIRHKFLKEDFPKNQPKIIKKNTESWDKNTIKYLEQVYPKQAHDFLSWLLSSETIWPRIWLSSGSVICLVRSISQEWISKKKVELFQKTFFVDNDNTFYITIFTTLKAALSSYQTILLNALQSEVWSCNWMGNLIKSNFLQRDLEIWDSRDFPNFPPFHQVNCQESCTFLFFFA